MDRDGRIDDLERHVARLDAELTALRARLEPPGTRRDAGAAPGAGRGAWAPPVVASPTRPAAWPEPDVRPPRPVGSPVSVDSETVLKWAGVGLVVLAIGFAVRTAISRGWIGPELQLAGAVLVAAALIVVGLRLRATRPAWTHALCSGGVLALFVTAASDLFLDELSTGVGFGSTAAVGAGGLVLARAIRSEWVATATLAGGAIGWAVIGRDDPAFVSALVWYVVLVAAVVAVSVEQRWSAAPLAAHVTGMIALLALAGEVDGAGDQLLLGVATALLAASLFSVPSIGDLGSVWQQLDIQLAAAATPWAFGVTFASVLEPERDAVIGGTGLAFAAATAALALTLRSRVRTPHFVSMLIGSSVTTSIALAVLLSTAVTFVALAVQAAGLVLLGRSLGDNLRVLINAGIVGLVAAVYVIGSMIDAWVDDAPIVDDVAHAAIVLALAVGAWRTGVRVIHVAAAVTVLALTLIWTGSVLVHLPQGQAVVSICWAAIGTAVFVAGAVRRHPEMGAIGLAVLGITVGKLLTVDLREVDTLWRAGLFFLVGVGLMRLGFMLPQLGRDAAPDDAGATRATVGRDRQA